MIATIGSGTGALAIGFPYGDSIIHAFYGGSDLHGAKIDGSSDQDICGVFIEPPDKVLGVDAFEHFIWSSAGTEMRNSPVDTDVALYGLRKWAGLACKGNPSVLQFLFASSLLTRKRKFDPWQYILDNRRAFLAVSQWKQFVGYANAQLARMAGGRSLKVNRPELVEAYGFDTKFAMHVIRIMVECEELLSTGVITFPSPEKGLLISIREGGVTQEWVMREAEKRVQTVKALAETSRALPAEIDRNDVSRIISTAYRRHWEELYR